MNRLCSWISIAALAGSTGCEKPASPAGATPGTASASTKSSGAVDGLILVTGRLPVEAPLPLPSSVSKVCGTVAESRTLEVGEGGNLAGAVVWLEAPAVSRLPEQRPATVFLDQRRCAYQPRVSAARAGDLLAVRSSDDLLHNVRAGMGSRTLFNLAMPFSGMKTVKPLPEHGGPVLVGCDVHPWMRAWVLTFEHPWFARTGQDGRFRIEQVTAGRHKLHLWHERLPERTLEVDVAESGATTVEASWDARELRSP